MRVAVVVFLAVLAVASARHAHGKRNRRELMLDPIIEGVVNYLTEEFKDNELQAFHDALDSQNDEIKDQMAAKLSENEAMDQVKTFGDLVTDLHAAVGKPMRVSWLEVPNENKVSELNAERRNANEDTARRHRRRLGTGVVKDVVKGAKTAGKFVGRQAVKVWDAAVDEITRWGLHEIISPNNEQPNANNAQPNANNEQTKEENKKD